MSNEPWAKPWSERKLKRSEVHYACDHLKALLGLPPKKFLLKTVLRPLLYTTFLLPLKKSDVEYLPVGGKIGQPNGEWVTPTAPEKTSIARKKSSKTILYFHGGAFCINRPKFYRSLTFPLARTTGCRVFTPVYRLSPEHRFPAAIEDCVASYDMLLQSGVAPRDIVFAGDSAGGNLVCSTMLYLLKGSRLPLPGAGVALSPWLDLEGLLCASRTFNKTRDLLLPAGCGYPEIVSWYADKEQLHDPLVSPLYATPETLSQFPPMHFEVSGTEMLLDDARILHQKLQEASAGNRPEKYTIFVEPNEPHGWQLFGDAYDVAMESFHRIATFVNGL